MENKRLLFVITGFTKGGAEKQFYTLLSNIKDDFDIQVVGFFDGYYREKIENLGIKVHLIPVKSNFGIFRAVHRVKKTAADFRPDIIQSMLPHANIVAKLVNVLSFRKYKLICGVRNSQEPGILGKLEKMTDRFSDKIITNSLSNREALSKRGFDAGKINVVYNGVSFQEPAEKYQLPQNTILTVAKFYPQKDYKTNVEVVEQLSKQRKDFVFYYVGDGPEKEEIKSLVKQKGLEEFIKFLGVRDDVSELMSSADAFFLPTKYEGQANVLLEAMYYGLPIITTDIPENREICEAEYAEAGDVEGFANILNNFLDDKINFDEKIIKNKEIVKQFEVENMVRSYLDIYEYI